MNIAEKENEVMEFWIKNRIYEKVKRLREGGKRFYFLDGPPYASGAIHIGTAWNKILKDVYIRFYRMLGYNVRDQPGYDTHGVPIENKVEKELGFHSKGDIEKYGVGNFIQKCREYATKYIDVMNNQFADLGVWMDWSNPYMTLTNDYIEGAWYTFKKAYEKGFLYKDVYPVHVCPHCETVVAYNEIEYKKLTDPAIYVKFPIVGKEKEYLVVWTTTPWTLPANTGVMVHPDITYCRVKVGDEILIIAEPRVEDVMNKAGLGYEIIEKFPGKKLEGMKYTNPLEEIFEIQKNLENGHRVVLSEQYVSAEDGTGLVHTAPGHGREDYKVGKENGLPILSPVKINGTYTDDCGEFSGVFVKSADGRIISFLEEGGYLLHKESVTHDYPVCWRCKSPLLIISIPQWFFRVTSIRDKLLEENEKVKWYPSWAKKRFDNWILSLGDWPISRQRYWGIPLPIWECPKCGNIKVIGSADELGVKLDDLHKPGIDEVTLKCDKCGAEMKRVPDVLDVWFDSGVASWATLGYPSNEEEFNKWWPADLNIEGPDQIRGWWNSQMITSVMTFDRAPFKSIVLHGFMLDAHGTKMSKSLGNNVQPEDVIKKYGRDVLRAYLLSIPPGENIYFNWPEVEEISKSLNIIRNSNKFVSTYVKNHGSENLLIEDKWILSRLSALEESVKKHLLSYKVNKAIEEILRFAVDDFSRWYIKLIRPRVRDIYNGADKEGAFFTLYTVMRELSKLLAPITPFLAEDIYQSMNKLKAEKESVHLEEYPSLSRRDENLEEWMDVVKEIFDAVVSIRQENKIKLRWPLKKIVVATHMNLSEMKDVIKRICNVEEVEIVKDFIDKTMEKKSFSAGIVYVDTSIKMEDAMIKELVRRVQNMRKELGLKVEDRIKLYISDQMFKEFEEKFKDVVGATEVIYGDNDGKEFEFMDKKVRIKIETSE